MKTVITVLVVLAVALAVAGELTAQVSISPDSLGNRARSGQMSNQDVLWQLTFDRPIDPDRYLIRPGEMLTLTFVNAQLPNQYLTLDVEGHVVHPGFGVVDLSGLTLTQAREVLRPFLARLYKAEDIVITVESVHTVPIYVTGAVKKPGRYFAWTAQTVADVIDSAGGLTGDASNRAIEFSGGPVTVTADLDRAFFAGDAEANPNLYCGHTVHVPYRSDEAVQIVGEVGCPRTVELLAGDDLETLISLAGGLRPSADPASVYIRNDSTRDPQQPGNIRSGDIIVVPRSAAAGGDSRVVVFGAVERPGRYTYHENMKLSELIDQAGGYNRSANASRVTLFRIASDRNSALQVAGRYPIYAGGTMVSGFTLWPSDSVFVPDRTGFVQISGVVARPGLYPYVAGENVGFYLRLAGGLQEPAEDAIIEIFDRVSQLTHRANNGELVGDGDRVIVSRRGWNE